MVMLWVSGFDILYALQDEEFDRQNGLHSVPAHFGQEKAKKIAMTIHSLCAVMLFVITWYQSQLLPSFGILTLGWSNRFCRIVILATPISV